MAEPPDGFNDDPRHENSRNDNPRRGDREYRPAPVGAVISDPRGTFPGANRRSTTSVMTARARHGGRRALEELGFRRRRTPTGELEPRNWGRLAATIGIFLFILIVWTSVHIVPPGTEAVPVTLGHPGKALDPGVHITLPFTTARGMSVRTENYTMTASKSAQKAKNVDGAVSVLGADGGAANIDATVLYRLNPQDATRVYKAVGTTFLDKIIRPSARSCIRTEFTNYDMVSAATTEWKTVEADVEQCMRQKMEPRGIQLQDFQLREVSLSAQLQSAVNTKVASQQNAEQQAFELQTAEQQADIARVNALATAESQQIIACGGHTVNTTINGKTVQQVVPNPITQCSQAQLTPQYLQFTYIQALKSLVNSPNNSTVILPFDQNLTPLLNLPAGQSSASVNTNAPTSSSSGSSGSGSSSSTSSSSGPVTPNPNGSSSNTTPTSSGR